MFWKSNDMLFEQLFKEHVSNTKQAARVLAELVEKPENRVELVQRIVELEHKGDDLVGKAHELLDSTFITRLDKADIVVLLDELDDVVDYIKSTANRIAVYGITQSNAEAREFASIIVKMVDGIDSLFGNIAKIQLASAKQQVFVLKGLEEEADVLLHRALQRLFQGGADWKEAMQWKDIYEGLERVTDHCEHVVNVVNSIARKEAN